VERADTLEDRHHRALYSTAKRKIAVETLWMTVAHAGEEHVLADWFYKERDEAFPSGLNVGEDGRALYHHFYLPAHSPLYPWPPGEYHLKVHARIAGRAREITLFDSPALLLPSTPGEKSPRPGEGFSFNWSPTERRYELASRVPARFGP
jgi:hypothetical protein